MDIVRGLHAPLPALVRPVVTLGAFDGVHRGHQRVLDETVAWAADLGGHSVVVTFDPLPKAVIGHEGALCITSLEHRLVLLGRRGIHLAVVLPFDARVAQMPAERFVRDLLLSWLGTRHIVFGLDSTFGRGAEGNLELLRRFEGQGLLSVRSPDPVLYQGQVISSTAIRQAIASGDLARAEAMLGRPFSLLGTVVRGDGRGRQLGFATANLDLHHEAIPPNGVYASLAFLDTSPLPSLTYVGRRPTFARDDADTAIEVHLIGVEADLYGRDIEVRFIRRLRDDVRFPTPEALIAQMHADREAAIAACHQALSPEHAN